MAIQRYPREQIRSQVPVSAADGNSDHVWNNRKLVEKPSMLYCGHHGEIVDGWAPGFHRRTQHRFFDDVGSWLTHFSGSIALPHRNETTNIGGTALEVNLLIIPIHTNTVFLPENFEEVQDNVAQAPIDLRCRVRQLHSGSTSWSHANVTEQTSMTMTTTLAFFPIETGGVSRYLRGKYLEFDLFDDGGLEEDSNNFIYREGHLWQEDFALVTWVQLEIDLEDKFFGALKPIRFDIEQRLNSQNDIDWFGASGDASSLGIGVVGSSIYALSYL